MPLFATRTHTKLSSRLRLISTGIVLAGASTANAQQIDYILDTGVGSFNIGPSQFDANMTWLNTFETQPGGEFITNISVSFGEIDDNEGNIGSDLVTVAILNDPNNDHNPEDAVLLATATGTWAEVGFSNFIDYPIIPTQVEGVFFVAVMMDVLQRANPASMDPNSPSAGNESWMFYNPKPNLEDLGSSPFILHMGASPFQGAWMIRAVGESTAGCPIDYNNDGVLNFFDVSAFLNLFSAQDLAADVTHDGILNFFDISLFLTIYSIGCPE